MFENLSYKARKRWAMAVLLVGLPIYVVVCITFVNMLERPPIWLEFLIYVALGVVWIFPFKGLFRGIAQPDPDAPDDDA